MPAADSPASPPAGPADRACTADGAGAADDLTAGAALRALREARGLSVDEVSAVTRIRAALVRDLEADRFDSSGGAVYARGHLRALARALQADPEPLVARFDRQAGGAVPGPASATVALPAARSGLLGVPVAERPERRGPHWAAAGAAALVVLVVLLAVGMTRDPAPDADGDLLAAPGATPGASAAPAATAAPPEAVAEAPAPTGAQLRVRVVGGESWISVSGSSGVLFEGTVRDGWFDDFADAAQLRLVVGNAGAVSLVCGGKDLGTAGGAGAVLRLTCGPSGVVPA